MKTLIYYPQSQQWRTIADSALTRNGQPWFLPDEGGQWNASLARAIRIGRLGKNISCDFARRYADAHTLLWVPQPEQPIDNADYIDGAAVCGTWLPATGSEEALQPLLDLLSRASRSTTFKTGDIIAVMTGSTPRAIVPGTHISHNIGDDEVLSFNIR